MRKYLSTLYPTICEGFRVRISRTRFVIRVLTISMFVVLTGCVSFPEVEDESSDTKILPIPQPQWTVGLQRDFVDLVKGENSGHEIMSISDNGELTVRSKRESTNGTCTWVTSSDWFAPASSWTNCGTGDWASGTQKVIHKGDQLWPLVAGKRAEYKRIPTSSKGEIGTPETIKCEVSGPVRVSVKAGDFDAMKVNCNSARSNGTKETQTWYWHQEHGEIKYRRASRVVKKALSQSLRLYPLLQN